MVNRIAKLADAMPADFEAALIKTEPNRFYFLDLDAGDAGTVLVLKDKAYFIIDSRYIEIARREVQTAEVILEKNALSQVAELLKKHNVKRLNVENYLKVLRRAEKRIAWCRANQRRISFSNCCGTA